MPLGTLDPAALQAAVRRHADALRARYPVVVDDTEWAVRDGALSVTGAVLVAAQAAGYQRALSEALELPLESVPRPAVLTDPDTPFEAVSWGALVGPGPVDLFAGPDGDDLQTQWPPGDHVRLFLADERARALVQLPDGTVGWIDRARVTPASPSEDPWGALARCAEGEVTPVHAALDAAAELARARLGRPYRWGGNTEAAADCSGFVQAVVLGGAGRLLPKNTRDQMKRGVRVAKGDVAPGDLLFVRGRDKNIMHVGLVLDAEGGPTVVHSCLSRGEVLEETLPVFLERYRFTAARRVIAWGAGS